MKVWISKYALSEGITEDEARQSLDGEWVDCSTKGYILKLGRHAHLTREAAVRAAEIMRVKKIASIKKQLAKLEAMRFE